MPELVKELQASGVSVFILSGGFKDLIVPFGKWLGVPPEKVHAVECNWEELVADDLQKKGAFRSINPTNGFADSKLRGAEMALGRGKLDKSVAVGDGFTDYILFKEGKSKSYQI